jgi:hypothetical protein
MKKLPVSIKNTLIALISVMLVTAFLTGCGDLETADDLVDESEQLRQTATDRFRRQTAAIDAMINSVASGRSLLITEIEAVTGTATRDYDAALADLQARSEKLDEAAALELNDNYSEYLRLLSASNDKLTEALSAAAEIPVLIIDEQLIFSGWNEIEAAGVLSAIESRRLVIDTAYDEAETLRAQAEKLRDDNPGDF